MDLVAFSDPLLLKAAFCIILNPLYWNIIAQTEYYYHWVSNLFCLRKKLAVTLLGITIVLLNVLRTYSIHEAIASQPKLEFLHPGVRFIGLGIAGIGQVLAITSFYKLGFYTSFLGDYFGIIVHDAPIRTFPYSICEDPMYWGGAMSYLGMSIFEGSPSGVLLSILVVIVYKVAISQESKMLHIIYSTKKST